MRPSFSSDGCSSLGRDGGGRPLRWRGGWSDARHLSTVGHRMLVVLTVAATPAAAADCPALNTSIFLKAHQLNCVLDGS